MDHGEDEVDLFVRKRSLEKSSVRRMLLQHMYKSGYKATAFDISRRTGICYTNIRGALIGDGKRYSKEKSLVGMGLVQSAVIASNLVVYWLTEKGQEIASKLEGGKYDRDNRSVEKI
jgi:predicted transcriptional regulator with HTH domain